MLAHVANRIVKAKRSDLDSIPTTEEHIFSAYGHDYGINSRANLNSWSSSYGLDAPGADRRLRSIRGQAGSVLKKIEHGAEQESPCFEVRCLRSHETFHASG